MQSTCYNRKYENMKCENSENALLCTEKDKKSIPRVLAEAENTLDACDNPRMQRGTPGPSTQKRAANC
jgi:hypothetical protein